MNNGFGVSPIELMASDAMMKKLIFCEEFDYVARWIAGTPTALTASNQLEVPIQIDGSSDFVIQAYNLTAFDDQGAIDPDANLLISFTKDGSGRRMSSGPVHVQNLCGSYSASKFPGRLGFPVLLAQKSTYSVLLQDLQAVNWDQVELLLHGFKVYYTPGAADPEEAHLANRQSIFHVL